MSGWKPTRDEAQFIGEVFAIDAGLAGHIADLLKKGHPLRNVRATLEDALRIAELVQGGRKPSTLPNTQEGRG